MLRMRTVTREICTLTSAIESIRGKTIKTDRPTSFDFVGKGILLLQQVGIGGLFFPCLLYPVLALLTFFFFFFFLFFFVVFIIIFFVRIQYCRNLKIKHTKKKKKKKKKKEKRENI